MESAYLRACSFCNALPSLGFHFESRQRTGREQSHRDSQVQGRLARLLQLCLQRRAIGTLGCRFYFEGHFDHGLAAIQLDAVLRYLGARANDFLEEARIHIHASNNDHIVRAPQNASFQS